MKVNGHGQAKVLTPEERDLLFTKGFLCARDKALFAFCYFTACRISEARQTRYTDIFFDDCVNQKVVIRKGVTKGQQATRSIPTNLKLAQFLEEYIQDSRELLEIKQAVGNWDHKSLQCSSIFSSENEPICPKCANRDITTAGESRGIRMYRCRNCLYRFQAKTAFLKYPELKSAAIRLGVYNSFSYGFLFLNPLNPYLFPGSEGNGCMSRSTPKGIFKDACKRVGIVGASTHSFRRTALTEMNKARVTLRTIQKISGHQRLHNLQKYLEVSREQCVEAIGYLPHFSHPLEEETYVDS